MYSLLKKTIMKYSTLAMSTKFPLSGYKYDDIDTSKSYRLRSLLCDIFDNRIDEGFHMAYNQMIEALSDKDFHFISKIADSKLERKLENCQIQLQNLNNGMKDLIYTDLTFVIGDKRETNQAIKLSLLDCINLDFYGSALERTPIDNVTLKIECYILSQLVMHQDKDDDESIYHRVLFESKQIEEAYGNADLIKVLMYNSSKRMKHLKNHFIGKHYEWRIMEIDQFSF